jgi:hypothetical protein
MKAFLFLSFMMMSTAAIAQPTGSRIPQDEFANGQVSDNREVRLIGARYGQCVVRKQPAAASAFVMTQAAQIDARAFQRLMSKVSDGPCLVEASRSFGGVQMRFPSDTLRYTLADALFRAQPGTAPLAIPTTLPALAHPAFRSGVSSGHGQGRQPEEARRTHLPPLAGDRPHLHVWVRRMRGALRSGQLTGLAHG